MKWLYYQVYVWQRLLRSWVMSLKQKKRQNSLRIMMMKESIWKLKMMLKNKLLIWMMKYRYSMKNCKLWIKVKTNIKLLRNSLQNKFLIFKKLFSTTLFKFSCPPSTKLTKSALIFLLFIKNQQMVQFVSKMIIKSL